MQVLGIKLILAVTFVQSLIVQNIVKRHAYINLGNIMLKRRLAEFDAKVHAQIIAFGKGQNKGTRKRATGGKLLKHHQKSHLAPKP